jgi:hypothetical protein
MSLFMAASLAVNSTKILAMRLAMALFVYSRTMVRIALVVHSLRID